MGGYGGIGGKVKGKCYYNTGGHKVKDKNAIEVAEHYINNGIYVAFLKEKPPSKRPDLSVDNKFLVEVKGMTSVIPHKFETNIAEGFKQIADEWSKYPKVNHHPGKVVILSRHENFSEAYEAAKIGYTMAKERGCVKGDVEFWYHGNIYKLK